MSPALLSLHLFPFPPWHFPFLAACLSELELVRRGTGGCDRERQCHFILPEGQSGTMTGKGRACFVGVLAFCTEPQHAASGI